MISIFDPATDIDLNAVDFGTPARDSQVQVSSCTRVDGSKSQPTSFSASAVRRSVARQSINLPRRE